MDPQRATSDILPASTETRERQCQHCLSGQVTPTGKVTASIWAVQVAYHCHDCAKGFVLLR